MLRAFLLLALVASLTFFAVCVWYSLIDWHELQRADAGFRGMALKPDTTMKTLFVLEARQNAHRINLFADGVWALLCAMGGVVCALGLRYERCTR
ncbi:hypothetical protein IAD21_02503 [Abditibacteriota bacterium]|nr:hypothetical protein IAD21_02503 [Abditibacteriota bacterium]